MRVLVLTHVFSSGYGVSLVVKKQLASLPRYNIREIFVGTPDLDDGQNGKTHHAAAWRLIRLDGDGAATTSLIKEIKPDAVIVHTPPYYRHVAQFRERSIAKIAFDYGEPTPAFFPISERIRREAVDMDKYDALREFHIHISISEFIKNCSAIASSRVLYLGADHIEDKKNEPGVDIRRHLGIHKKTFVMTFLARMGAGERWYKGFDVLMLLKKRLSQSLGDGVAFIVTGRAAHGGGLLKKDLQAAGFYVLDNVEEDLKRDILSQSDVYLSPSLWEGFDLPLVEAQFLGVPSIALSTGAHPEVCPFHFDSLYELMNFLQILYEDRSLLRRCGQVCRDYIRKKFRWDDHVSKLVDVLRETVLEKGELPTLKIG